jgi:hypothetical protein
VPRLSGVEGDGCAAAIVARYREGEATRRRLRPPPWRLVPGITGQAGEVLPASDLGPVPPWSRPVICVMLRDGDQDTPRLTAQVSTAACPRTRLGHFPADLPTTQANDHAALPRGSASSGDVPGPGR